MIFKFKCRAVNYEDCLEVTKSEQSNNVVVSVQNNLDVYSSELSKKDVKNLIKSLNLLYREMKDE